MKMVRKAFFLYLIVCVYVKKMFCQKTNFVFPEYPYKETNKNEVAYREFETACEQTPSCTPLKGSDRVRCVRECISPACYQHIYSRDPLEEGEIDVRLNSFKGCFIQRSGRTR